MMSNENTGGACQNEDKGVLSVFTMLIMKATRRWVMLLRNWIVEFV